MRIVGTPSTTQSWVSGVSHKLFEPDSDGPKARLEVEQAGEYTRLYLKRKTADGWTTTGVIELHPALDTDYQGNCKPGTILEWAYFHFHASGDRTKMSHRVRVLELGGGVEICHENAREHILGFGEREEHDWQTLESWWLRSGGVETREVADSR